MITESQRPANLSPPFEPDACFQPAEESRETVQAEETEAAEFWRSPFSAVIQRTMIEAIRKHRLQSDDDVRKLIGWLKEPKVGEQVNCTQKDHTPPFRMVADVLTGRAHDYVAWANRSGGKTYWPA